MFSTSEAYVSWFLNSEKLITDPKTHIRDESYYRTILKKVLMPHESPKGPSHTCSRREREAHYSSSNNFTSSSITLFAASIEEQTKSNRALLPLLSYLYCWVEWYFTALYQKVLLKYCQLMLKRGGLCVHGQKRAFQGLNLLWGLNEVKKLSAFCFASLFLQPPK